MVSFHSSNIFISTLISLKLVNKKMWEHINVLAYFEVIKIKKNREKM